MAVDFKLMLLSTQEQYILLHEALNNRFTNHRSSVFSGRLPHSSEDQQRSSTGCHLHKNTALIPDGQSVYPLLDGGNDRLASSSKCDQRITDKYGLRQDPSDRDDSFSGGRENPFVTSSTSLRAKPPAIKREELAARELQFEGSDHQPLTSTPVDQERGNSGTS